MTTAKPKKIKAKKAFKPGDALYVNVGPEHIGDSDPCNKDNCMLSRSIIDFLVSTYGGKASDFKVKSTNHGVTFDLNGRKYVVVFDTNTARRIYKYDQTFKETRSKEKARATVRPFKTRMMIEASSAVTKWPTMSEETKSKLRALPRKDKARTHTPKATGTRRELSL